MVVDTYSNPEPSRACPVINVRLCEPLAVVFALRVICDDESIDLIVVIVSGAPGVRTPGSVGKGMPVPETASPTNRPLVLDRFFTTADPLVKVPVLTTPSPGAVAVG